MAAVSSSLRVIACPNHSAKTTILHQHKKCSLIASCLHCFQENLKTKVDPKCSYCNQLLTEESRFILIDSETGVKKGNAGLAPKMIIGTTSKINGMYQFYINSASPPESTCVIL